ncbi:MAG: amidase family protein [Haloferacaceae archaeon]
MANEGDGRDRRGPEPRVGGAGRPLPDLRPPSAERIRDLAERLSLGLSDADAAAFADLVGDRMGAFERLEELSDGPGAPGGRPGDPGGARTDPGGAAGDDPYNAFVTRCEVPGAADGPLAGVTVGVKDNIAVAGVEMTCGSRVFAGYRPRRDATVVTRLLAAGATVVGKTAMDDMAVSGTGGVTPTDPVLNPRDPAHLAGGSSGGSAAAVVAGDVDLALGTDQAGSVRLPAAWCGCVGLKPTHGLVPYTGVAPLGHTYDHVGVLTRTVEGCARALSVLAGPDGRDPRQAGGGGATGASPAAYADAPDRGADDLAVGVLEEGFVGEEPPIDAAVRDRVAGLGEGTDGPAVRDVSVPLHADGPAVWLGIVPETIATLARESGVGHHVGGRYDTDYLRAFARLAEARGDRFPPTMKFVLLLGAYVRDEYRGYYHAVARNLARDLRAAYDRALDDVDVLALPTTPVTAYEACEGLDGPELVERAYVGRRVVNTAPFNVTGHPAVSVPCGTVDGLPVGLMLVGRRGADATVLRAAAAVERAGT